MRSHSSSLILQHHSQLRRFPIRQRSSFITTNNFRRLDLVSRRRNSHSLYDLILKLNGLNVRKYGSQLQRGTVQVRAFGEDFDVSTFDNWSDNEGTAGYIFSSSGEESDGEIVLNQFTDTDLPAVSVSNNEALTVTAHRLAIMGRARKRHRIKLGLFINLGLISFLTLLLLFVDWCAWKIVRLPLAPFYLTQPFFISVILASCAGYICVPFLRSLKIRQIIREEGPARHSRKRRTPTMGGVFFIPIGVAVANAITGFSSIEVSGASLATLAFAVIGLIDDILCLIKSHTSGLSAWTRLILEVAVGSWFSFWLDATSLSSPYGMYSFLSLI